MNQTLKTQTQNSKEQHLEQKQIDQTLNLEKDKFRKFQYQLLKEYHGLENWMNCMVFNLDSTLLFMGINNQIKVYEFKDGQIGNLLQTLPDQKTLISCLSFMKKSNQLISGVLFHSIVIWNQDQNSNWKSNQTIDISSDNVTCMVYNENEDLIITGSDENTRINFFRKQNTNWSCCQMIQTEFQVCGLKLNKSQTRLISCGLDLNQILVMEEKSNCEWAIIQIIEVGKDGQQLCFISDNQFAYQGYQGILEIFTYEQNKKQFIKEQSIPVQEYNGNQSDLFPCQYLEDQNILIIRNGGYLNIFGLYQNHNFILQDSIELPVHQFSFAGVVSHNGQFLVIYICQSENFQVRKLQYTD